MKDATGNSGRVVFMSAAPGVWGAEESLLTLAKALKAEGVEVALVTFPGSLEARWQDEVRGELLLASPLANPDERKLLSSLALWRRYVKGSRRKDALILFTYYLVATAAIARIVLARQSVRIFLDMHDNLPRRRGRALLQLASLAVDRVIAVSAFTASQFGPLHGKVTVLNRPVEATDDVVDLTTNRSSLHLGIVGRLVEEKGHDLLLDALSLVSFDFKLIVRGAGDGSRRDTTQHVVQRGRRELGQNFSYEGRVPRNEVMQGLDVLVVANNKEPMGRTVIEAQLSGVIAVVPDEGGSSELVEHGSTGLKYRAGDARSLADALHSLVEVPGLRSHLRVRAKNASEVSSSPSAYATSYRAALQP